MEDNDFNLLNSLCSYIKYSCCEYSNRIIKSKVNWVYLHIYYNEDAINCKVIIVDQMFFSSRLSNLKLFVLDYDKVLDLLTIMLVWKNLTRTGKCDYGTILVHSTINVCKIPYLPIFTITVRLLMQKCIHIRAV